MENSEQGPALSQREQRLLKQQAYMKEVERTQIAENADAVTALKENCVVQGREITDTDFAYSHETGLTANSPGLVQLLHPELTVNKDGLYNLRALQAAQKALPSPHQVGFAPGHVQTSRGILFAHPFFRRGHHKDSDWAPEFVDIFWRRLRDPAIEVLVALDPDRIKVDFGEPSFSFDTWQGVSFKQDIASNSDGVVKLRPSPEEELALLFENVYSLDIEWRTKEDGIKTFYAEEFMDDSVLVEHEGDIYHPARYIHAEFDLAGGYFRHFDGALHFYDSQAYKSRRDSDFNYNRKNPVPVKAKPLKLFRLDGQISVETWMLLTTHFLSKDPLIIEYFTGRYPEPLEELRQYLRSQSPTHTNPVP